LKDDIDYQNQPPMAYFRSVGKDLPR